MLKMAAKPQQDNIERRSARSTQLFVSAGLSILFVVVYGGCNWLTAHRGNVPTFFFEWERGIPFVPFLIIPYLSIDLFFIAAPFLCRTNEELRIWAKRIVFSILAAGTCFLIVPLRFAFVRPHANGFGGAFFDWFRTLDAPYNLVPSLHATFWVFLVDLYARRTAGVWRILIMLWFVLIGLSPVFTYQHHVIDIFGGFVLAGVGFLLFRERFSSLPKSPAPNNRAASPPLTL